MEDVRLFVAARPRQTKASKAWIAHGVVVSGQQAREGGDGVDADAEQVVGAGLVEGQRVLRHARELGEEIGVAELRKPRALGGSGQPRQVVLLRGLETHDVAAHRVGERRLPEELGHRPFAEAAQEAVGAEGLLVEEDSGPQAQARVELLIEGGVEAAGVDAQLAKQARRDLAVPPGGLDRLRPAVTQEHPVSRSELVALRMAAEVVVVLENQDARLGPRGLAPEPGGGEAADPAADDHEVVALAGVHGGRRVSQNEPSLRSCATA